MNLQATYPRKLAPARFLTLPDVSQVVFESEQTFYLILRVALVPVTVSPTVSMAIATVAVVALQRILDLNRSEGGR